MHIKFVTIHSYEEYLKKVVADVAEKNIFVNLLTTNLTFFFREPDAFEFLKDKVSSKFEGKTFTVWSAACSSGEEPYTIAILLSSYMKDISNVKILATDLSTLVLGQANKGTYNNESIRRIPDFLRGEFFDKCEDDLYKVKESLRSMVRFARLNLFEPWPFQSKFDVVFCRNVMIYFDAVKREELIDKFWKVINPGGYLIVGVTEGFREKPNKFKRVSTSIYEKIE